MKNGGQKYNAEYAEYGNIGVCRTWALLLLLAPPPPPFLQCEKLNCNGLVFTSMLSLVLIVK